MRLAKRSGVRVLTMEESTHWLICFHLFKKGVDAIDLFVHCHKIEWLDERIEASSGNSQKHDVHEKYAEQVPCEAPKDNCTYMT